MNATLSTSWTPEIDALDAQLKQLVAAAAPRTTQLLGITTGTPGSCS